MLPAHQHRRTGENSHRHTHMDRCRKSISTLSTFWLFNLMHTKQISFGSISLGNSLVTVRIKGGGGKGRVNQGVGKKKTEDRQSSGLHDTFVPKKITLGTFCHLALKAMQWQWIECFSHSKKKKR